MSTLYSLSLVFVGLRALSKFMTRTFCTEDYIIISAVILTIVPLAAVLYSEF